MPSDNTKRAEPSEWATLEAQRVCDAGGAWTGELVTNIALSLDAAEQRGRESVEAELRGAIEHEEREAETAMSAALREAYLRHRHAVRALRSLLVAEKEE